MNKKMGNKDPMHTEKLLSFLSAIMPVSQLLREHVKKSATHEVFKRGLLLASEGKPSNQAWFISSGLAKEYYYDESGKQVIVNFWQEGEMMVVVENFFANERAETCIELIEDSTLLTFQKKESMLLKTEYPELHQIGYKVMIMAKKKSDERAKLLTLSTKKRFVEFQKQFISWRFSGTDTSSYLGMSREQLTRLKS